MQVKATAKGQVVIPKTMRDALNIKAGTMLIVESRGRTVTFRPASAPKKHSIDELIGCLRFNGPPKSLDDMERGVEAAIDERWGRARR